MEPTQVSSCSVSFCSVYFFYPLKHWVLEGAVVDFQFRRRWRSVIKDVKEITSRSLQEYWAQSSGRPKVAECREMPIGLESTSDMLLRYIWQRFVTARHEMNMCVRLQGEPPHPSQVLEILGGKIWWHLKTTLNCNKVKRAQIDVILDALYLVQQGKFTWNLFCRRVEEQVKKKESQATVLDIPKKGLTKHRVRVIRYS